MRCVKQSSKKAAIRLQPTLRDRHPQEVAGQNGIVYNNCSASNFISAVGGIPGLQTSASLLNSTIPVIGVPNNSTLLLPTDAAWAAFRAANGALRPSASCDTPHHHDGNGVGGSCARCPVLCAVCVCWKGRPVRPLVGPIAFLRTLHAASKPHCVELVNSSRKCNTGALYTIFCLHESDWYTRSVPVLCTGASAPDANRTLAILLYSRCKFPASSRSVADAMLLMLVEVLSQRGRVQLDYAGLEQGCCMPAGLPLPHDLECTGCCFAKTW